MLILNNIGRHTVIVERIDLVFDGKRIGGIDVLRNTAYCESAIISPDKEVRIALDPGALRLNIQGRPAENPDTIYKLTAIVTTSNKKQYKSSYRYCYHDLSYLMYAEAFE